MCRQAAWAALAWIAPVCAALLASNEVLGREDYRRMGVRVGYESADLGWLVWVLAASGLALIMLN